MGVILRRILAIAFLPVGLTLVTASALLLPERFDQPIYYTLTNFYRRLMRWEEI